MAVGARGDLTIFDPDGGVVATIIGGEMSPSRPSGERSMTSDQTLWDEIHQQPDRLEAVIEETAVRSPGSERSSMGPMSGGC